MVTEALKSSYPSEIRLKVSNFSSNLTKRLHGNKWDISGE